MFPFIDDDSYNSTILATTFATTVVDFFSHFAGGNFQVLSLLMQTGWPYALLCGSLVPCFGVGLGGILGGSSQEEASG